MAAGGDERPTAKLSYRRTREGERGVGLWLLGARLIERVPPMLDWMSP